MSQSREATVSSEVLPFDAAGAWIATVVEQIATFGGRLESRCVATVPTLPCMRWPAVRLAGSVASGLQRAIQEHPRKTRGMLMALLIALCMFGAPHPARSSFLDDINTQLSTFGGFDGTTWMDNALNVARRLFLFIAAIAVAYNLVSYYVTFQTWRGSVPGLLRTLIMVGVPLAVLNGAQPVLDGIFQIASYLAGQVSGYGTTPTTPGGVFHEGVTVAIGLAQTYATNVFQQFTHAANCPSGGIGGGVTGALCWGNFIGQKFMQILMTLSLFGFILVLAIFAILAFAFISVELLMAYAYAFLTLPLGAWTLGFSAAAATESFANAYWGAVMRALMRFIVIFAMVAFVQLVFAKWGTSITAVQGTVWDFANPVHFGAQIWNYFVVCIEMMVGAVALAFLVMRTAATADSVAGGRASVSFAGGLATGAGLAYMGTRMAGMGSSARASSALGSGGRALGGAAGDLRGAADELRNSAAELRQLMQGP